MNTLRALGRMNHIAVVDTLSEREIDVIELVAVGMSNREIAQVTSLSEKTVKQHIVNIHSKLSLSNSDGNPRVLLTLFAIRHGLIVAE